MHKKAEILAPAGSMEALRAAVCNGADAVYLGVGDFNARRLAKNFTERDLTTVCDYCHKRGVKVYVTVNTHITDREAELVEALARDINRAGVDAVIVADFGVARIFRSVAPEIALHASTQMTVHNLEGVKYLSSLGFSRVVLARELSREEIRYICKESPMEIEVFVHGALCMCYSGQCEMSAVIGRRSGNRGLCAQPCRMQYKLGEAGVSSYPLSLRDLCLADYITELSDMGVASLKIEGRMKRAEYVAIVTGIYSRILNEGRVATDKEKRVLNDIFSRSGFTEGYYKSQLEKEMFGIRTETNAPENLLAAARKTYEKDIQEKTSDVEMFCIIQKDRPAVLAAITGKGERAYAEGKVPELARNVPLTYEAVETQLKKTGGTGFVVSKVNIKLDEGLSLPLSELNALRREVLEKFPGGEKTERPEGKFNTGFRLVNRKTPPRFTVSVRSVSQISDELLSRDIAYMYIPLCEFEEKNIPRIRETAEKCVVVASFPRIIKDTETDLLRIYAQNANEAGVFRASVGNTGHIEMAKSLGFSELFADFGINVFNSYALREIRHTGVQSVLLSPELTFPQIRDISKIIDTEIVVYGRLPLMICENCVIKSQTGACVCASHHVLCDRTGASFPLLREFNHRTLIVNSKKLFLADKARDWKSVGVAFARLYFTSENSRECVQVFDAYSGGEPFVPHEYTRGLYYRGVE